ncbi:MAG TPA: hypothetical protein VG245_09615, partial [Candidatus Dormibacteraeota bacterium]|nr:hypothetical protein [Candidatus Dormibacteraeota bacterium]
MADPGGAGVATPDLAFLKEAGERWAQQQPPEPADWRIEPAVEVYEEDEDTGGGAGVMRVSRAQEAGLERQGQGYLRATARAERPDDGLGRLVADIRGFLLGAPLASARLTHERLTKVKALA